MPASRTKIAIALALGALLLGPAPARAALVLTVNSSTAASGGIGSFDVILSSTSGTFGVGGFSVELTVASASGVKFTGANGNTTAAPYIFGTVQVPPLSTATFPNTDFVAMDLDNAAPFFVNVTPTSPFAVEHVTYSVAAGTAAGPVTVSIAGLTGPAPKTQINDVIGTPFAFTPVNGTITVTAASVPEPSSLLLTSAAMVGGFLIAIGRRSIGRRPVVSS